MYAYDSCGNILSRTEYGYTDAETPAGGTAAVYEYNNAAWGDQLTSWNGESITYDAIGNPLLYRGRSLTWTQGRRLAGVSSEGLAAYYTYDESGTRIGKTVNGVSTQYYINGSQILAQKRGEDILYFLYDETGSAVGFKYNNNLYLYRKNLQGDILAVLNGQTGATEASYTYDAWGRVISSTGSLAEINPFRYRGYYYDSETGMYYLQSRYYDPETGRFINADGVIDESNLNVNGFAYCGNNPVLRSDKSGYAYCNTILPINCGGYVSNEVEFLKAFSSNYGFDFENFPSSDAWLSSRITDIRVAKLRYEEDLGSRIRDIIYDGSDYALAQSVIDLMAIDRNTIISKALSLVRIGDLPYATSIRTVYVVYYTEVLDRFETFISALFNCEIEIQRQWVAMFYVGAGTLENGDMFFEHHYATHKKRLQEDIYFYFKR